MALWACVSITHGYETQCDKLCDYHDALHQLQVGGLMFAILDCAVLRLVALCAVRSSRLSYPT